MATIAQLAAAKQPLLAQLAEIRRQRLEILLKRNDGSLTEAEGSAAVRANTLLRREAEVVDLDREIEKGGPQYATSV